MVYCMVSIWSLKEGLLRSFLAFQKTAKMDKMRTFGFIQILDFPWFKSIKLNSIQHIHNIHKRTHTHATLKFISKLGTPNTLMWTAEALYWSGGASIVWCLVYRLWNHQMKNDANHFNTNSNEQKFVCVWIHVCVCVSVNMNILLHFSIIG